MTDAERLMECINCRHLDKCRAGNEVEDEQGHCTKFEEWEQDNK